VPGEGKARKQQHSGSVVFAGVRPGRNTKVRARAMLENDLSGVGDRTAPRERKGRRPSAWFQAVRNKVKERGERCSGPELEGA